MHNAHFPLSRKRDLLRMAVLFLVAFLVLIPLATPSAHAQTQTGLSIAPPITDLVVSPGEQVIKSLTIENKGNGPVKVKLYANNFTAQGDQGGFSYEPTGSGGLADWLLINPSSFELNAGEEQVVSVIFAIPEGASAGGHYATVFAASSAVGSTVNGSGAAVSNVLGAHFLANMSGQITERATMGEFSTPRQRYNAGEDVEFNVRMTNTGNTHLTPTGVVELYRKGVKMDEISLNATGAKVLPNSSRAFSVSSSKVLLPGVYTAKATIMYGADQVIVSPEISFSAIGDSSVMTYFFGGIVALIVLIGVMFLMGRKKIIVQ